MHAPAKPRGNSWLTTFFLAWLLGGLGVDRFYNGRTGLGIGKLLTGGLCGLWTFIDVLLLLFKRYKDGQGNTLMPAKRSDLMIALSVMGAAMLATVIAMGTAVHQIKTELAGLMEGGSGGSSSPAVAWAGFQRAAQDKDFATFFEYFTPESQDMVIGMTMMQIAMKKAFAGPNAGTTAEEQRIKAVFEKYGISTVPGGSMKNDLSRVPDKGRLFKELMEARSDGGGDDDTDLGLPSGALTDVIMTGDKATGKVDGEALAFKRVGGAWLVDLKGTMQAAMKTAFNSGEVEWGPATPRGSSPRARSGQSARSLQELENGVSETPDDPSAWYELAAKRTAYGDWAAAIDDLNRAFKLNAAQIAADPNARDLKAAVIGDDRFYWLLQQNPEFKKTLSRSR